MTLSLMPLIHMLLCRCCHYRRLSVTVPYPPSCCPSDHARRAPSRCLKRTRHLSILLRPLCGYCAAAAMPRAAGRATPRYGAADAHDIYGVVAPFLPTDVYTLCRRVQISYASIAPLLSPPERFSCHREAYADAAIIAAAIFADARHATRPPSPPALAADFRHYVARHFRLSPMPRRHYYAGCPCHDAPMRAAQFDAPRPRCVFAIAHVITPRAPAIHLFPAQRHAMPAPLFSADYSVRHCPRPRLRA